MEENLRGEVAIGEENSLIAKTFFWMFLGLLGTAIMSWYTYSTGAFDSIITEGYFYVLLIVELVVVLLFSFLFMKLPATIAAILYFSYAMLNGVTFAIIFEMFELSSIVYTFVGTAVLFGGLALYGYKTKADLSSWRNVLYGGLIIGIILSVVNLFMGNSMLDIILDWAILAIFCGLTIYDMNKIKMLESSGLDQSKLHIYGAMQLYLDFINIFIRILSIFGRRK